MNLATVVEALIPLAAGAYATLLGYRMIKRPTIDPKKNAVLDHLKWLGPLVIVFGAWQLVQGVVERPRPSARDIVAGMRQKMKLPVTVDEVTRLDAVDAEGERIVYRLTITKASPAQSDGNAFIARMREQLKSRICSDERRRRLLDQDISLSFVYTVGDKSYPGIVLTRADCGGG